jgi:hypothetical protein
MLLFVQSAKSLQILIVIFNVHFHIVQIGAKMLFYLKDIRMIALQKDNNKKKRKFKKK